MTDRTVSHGTFVVDRRLKASPARVYAAFADKAQKDKWFGSSEAWDKIDEHFDFREGGSERLAGKWRSGMISAFFARYEEIIPNERIVYTYAMEIDGVRISVSVATIEIKPDGQGSRLVITEMGAYFDGHAAEGCRMREMGTNQLIDKLVESVEMAPA